MKRLGTILLLTACVVLLVLSGAALARQVVTKSVTAQNTFSDPIALFGQFNFSLSGTWTATCHLQRSYDMGVTWLDVQAFTTNTEMIGNEPEPGIVYRAGVKTGNFTSGTVVIRIGQ